jgi:hypothetical protein
MTNTRRLAYSVIAAAALIAVSGCGPVRTSEARPVVAPAHVPGGDWFVQTGCTKCHSVSVYGIHTLASTAPDLSIAVEDVPRRFGRDLDDFFTAPTGTMAMVLATAIPMTKEERLVAIAKLKEAYRRRQEATGAGPPVASR